MDPAEFAQLQGAVALQGQLLGQHENHLAQMNDRLAQLVTAVQALTVTPPSAVAPGGHQAQRGADGAPAVTPREPHVSPPERYSGESGSSCRGFISQCTLIFTLQPSAFTTDGAMVAYIMTLLSGRALAWANALLEKQSPLCSDFDRFIDEMKRVFDCPVRGRDAATRLLNLRQGRNSAANYAIEFRVLAAESEWSDAALIPTFLHGLSDEVKDELVSRELSEGLDSLITLAIQVDNRIREYRRERRLRMGPRAPDYSRVGPSAPEYSRAGPSAPDYSRLGPSASDYSRMVPNPPTSSAATDFSSAEEPMHLGRTRLTPRERQRRISKKLCLYCGESGHFLVSCPEREGNESAQQ